MFRIAEDIYYVSPKLDLPMVIPEFVIALVIALIVFVYALNVHRNNFKLKKYKELSDSILKAFEEYSNKQHEFISKYERQLHEVKNKFLTIKNFAADGKLEKIKEYTDSILRTDDYVIIEYSGNSVIDSIVNYEFIRAKDCQIYIEYEIAEINTDLSMFDYDMTALLMNVLNNAIDACKQVENTELRWLKLKIISQSDNLILECHNSALPYRPSKGLGHGYGTAIMNNVVKKYSGTLNSVDHDDSYSLRIEFPLK